LDQVGFHFLNAFLRGLVTSHQALPFLPTLFLHLFAGQRPSFIFVLFRPIYLVSIAPWSCHFPPGSLICFAAALPSICLWTRLLRNWIGLDFRKCPFAPCRMWRSPGNPIALALPDFRPRDVLPLLLSLLFLRVFFFVPPCVAEASGPPLALHLFPGFFYLLNVYVARGP